MQTVNDIRNRPHWSYSALNQILNICSLQYFFQRVAKLKPAFTPLPLSFGSAFHRTLEWVAHMRKDGETITPEDSSDLFNEVWKRQLEQDGDISFNGTDPDELAAQGMKMVGCFVSGIDPDEEIVGVSECFTVPVTDSEGNTMETPLVGEIDCVVRKDGGIKLVDWKSSARRWSSDQAHKNLQPTAYLYAYNQIKPSEQPSFRFDVVVKNKQPVVEHHETTRTEDDFLRMGRLITAAESIVQHEAYHPSETSYFCAGCPFQGPCQAWHRQNAKLISTAA